jgi:hypothetical protein
MFDVCSSLALVHSRRLVHRDISPRNVRCTRDGRAKLIDFGAMAPMSAGGADVVGTPAFVAPETLHRLALDGRTDLYSLGATFYYCLTGRPPYAARTFADVLDSWRHDVLSPARFAPELPAALVELVLALIALEPALRPRTASEVMQRLAACAGLPPGESLDVSRAYLATPILVGRDAVLDTLRECLTAARGGRGAGVVLGAAPGGGRSRVLDACVLEAKTQGFTVLRGVAIGALEPFKLAQALIEHLVDALPLADALETYPELFEAQPTAQAAAPTLRDFTDPKLIASEAQHTLCRALLRHVRSRPLLIAVDDVQRADAPSAAVLAQLIDSGGKARLLIALTADTGEPENEVLRVLADRCQAVALKPLRRDETLLLLESLFGDVSNLGMLSDEIYKVAHGNPRQSMDLAQHLVDRGVVHYVAGHWTLPSRLAAEDLPASAAAAMHQQIAALSETARFLAQAQALAFYEGWHDQDYRALLPEVSSGVIEQALYELLAARAIVRDDALYMVANRVWVASLIAEANDEQRQRLHRALAGLYSPRSGVALVHHSFAGGLHEQGLEALLLHHASLHRSDHKQLIEQNVGKMMWCAPLALETAERTGKSRREIAEMRRWLFAGNITYEEGQYDDSGRLWFEQLAHDSGLTMYREDTETTDHGQRLTLALTRAHERYQATPAAQRVYAVDEAIRLLGEYVVYSIALGARNQDDQLIASLPSILEPFAALSPVLWALWHNALATHEGQRLGQYEQARDRWLEVLAKLEPLRGGELAYIEPLINAVVFAIGMMEVQLGLPTAASWAERLDHDPYQRISALHLRKIVCLQRGDAAGAERFRRQAEVLALQMRSPQMFKSLLSAETFACVKSHDLAGVQRLIPLIEPEARRNRGWGGNLTAAEGGFELLRGDFEAARRRFSEGLERLHVSPDGKPENPPQWLGARAGLAEALLGLGRAEEARQCAAEALAVCQGERLASYVADVACALALAEAKLGDASAAARLDAVIAEYERLGVEGLRLGLVFEARAWVALWTGDATAFDLFAEHTAREYRHGSHSPLATRYARLLQEAAQRGWKVRSARQMLEEHLTLGEEGTASDDFVTMASRSVATQGSSQARAQLALNLICTTHAASEGHLFLYSRGALSLCASRADAPPARALIVAVDGCIERERARAEGLDDMVTGELDESEGAAPSVAIDGRVYHTVVLRCIVEEAAVIAGVAALLVDQVPDQRALLAALATEFLRAGDATGLKLAPV